MTEQKSPIKVTSPLIVGGALLLLVASAFAVSSKSKSAVAPAPTSQPSKAQSSEMHDAYEQPKESNGLIVVDIIKGGEIEQKTITVKPNVVIAFKNEDNIPHEIVSDDTGKDAFSTGVVKPGEQLYIAQYKTPGTYTYHVKSDPSKKGTVIVKE